ncbi:MAG: AzlC family ABC transporter permease [Oscillibacter sp.]|nr:AzlC family ABC transporter permease [Oscillibacter sp.]
MKQKNPIWSAFLAAFPCTIPVLTGYAFLGMALGIYMSVAGFSVWLTLLMGLAIYAGSLEFLAVSILVAPYAPLQTFIVSLMLQARHLFYGITLLEKYKDSGWKKPYLIHAITDETFSINCTAEVPEHVDRVWFYFFTSLLDHSYWVIASIIGGVLGNLIPFNSEGLDFVMTAMFVVIMLEQWLKDDDHSSAWIGLIASVGCLMIFGPDNFLIPTMICILAALTVLRKIKTKVVGDIK